MRFPRATFAAALFSASYADAFVPQNGRSLGVSSLQRISRSQTTTSLQMVDLDPVTYLRTEWISAALCTNQTPRSADVVLQLGCEDGRAVSFIPRTVRTLITSSLEADGKLTVSTRRQLKQQQQRRGAASVKYVDQRADDLTETEDESVDVVISLQAAAKMIEQGLDWKRSIREANRVLKPGGRLLFVEQTDLNGENYVDYIAGLASLVEGEDGDEKYPLFDDGGVDPVDLVLVPHVAGMAIKSLNAGLTPAERAAKEAREKADQLAELTIQAYEGGITKRRRKKKKKVGADDEISNSSE
jgi:SAM-dependent methyltransferase